MPNDVLEPIKVIDQMIVDTSEAMKLAEAKGDDEAYQKLDRLFDDLLATRDEVLAGLLAGIAGKMTDYSKRLEALTARVKAWPFGGTHERQYRDKDLPDNDFEDAGPDAPLVTPAPVKADATPVVSAEWSENYQTLWDTMEVSDDWASKATYIAKKIVTGQSKYAAAVAGTQIPWWFVGVAHSMESGLDFTTHLYNGDPLTDRTVHHPPGRPAVIQGLPIDWIYSAKDSLRYERLDKVTDWSLPSVLFHWHRYNGISNEYKKRHIPTPYLWSGTQHYVKGRYTSDHEFNPQSVSKQVGAAVLLRALIDLNAVDLVTNKTGTGKKAVVVQNPVSNPAAAVQHIPSLAIDLSGAPFKHIAAELDYPGDLKQGAKGKGVERIQEWLSLQGFATPVDGDFGASTETQLQRFSAKNGRADIAVLDEEIWALLTAPLRKALAPLPKTPSLETHVIKVARQHIEQRPTEVGGANSGPWVRTYMGGADGSPQLWCAGFISFVIDQAVRDLGVKIPFKRQVGVDNLVEDAKKDGRFVAEGEVKSPLLRQSKIKPGDLFVVRGVTSDWTHAGFVEVVMAETFDTFEGNSNNDGSSNGTVALERNRSYPKKDFIRIL